METEEYGLAKLLKPHIDEDGLRQVDSLEGEVSLTDFDYTDKAVRHLAVAEQTLLGGRMSKVEAQRVTFDQVSLQSVLIERCVLSSCDWMDCALSRVVFRNCKILGANFVENKWANVVFQNCRIEFVTEFGTQEYTGDGPNDFAHPRPARRHPDRYPNHDCRDR